MLPGGPCCPRLGVRSLAHLCALLPAHHLFRQLTPQSHPCPARPSCARLPRAAKALEGALAEIKQDAFPRCPTRAVCGAYIALQVGAARRGAYASGWWCCGGGGYCHRPVRHRLVPACCWRAPWLQRPGALLSQPPALARPLPLHPHIAVVATHPPAPPPTLPPTRLQREVIELLELKRGVQAKQVRPPARSVPARGLALHGAAAFRRCLLRLPALPQACPPSPPWPRPHLPCPLPACPCHPLQHMLAGMKRAKREEDADETPGGKRQRMGK